MGELASSAGAANYNHSDHANNYASNSNTNNRLSDEVISVASSNRRSSKDNKSVASVKSREEMKMDEKYEGDSLESALAQLGHFKLYQKYMLFMLCLPNLLAAMYSLNYVFVAAPIDFRCVVPECEGFPASEFDNDQVQPLLHPETKCSRYEPLVADRQSCDRSDYNLNQTVDCTELVYETMESIFAEFGLGCRKWMGTLVGTVRNSALPFALFLTGFVSDTYGRRTAFCIFSAFAGLLGFIKAFSVNYYMYISMEFFEAALGYGFNSAAYVMMVELARPSLRAAFACATGVAYGLGGCLFALIAWKIPYWRHLLWTIHTPALLMPLYWILIDESPRWLYATGKVDETVRVVKKAARWNKISLNENTMERLRKKKHKDKDPDSPKINPWLSLFKSKILMGRFIVCSFCWVATTFVYYGLTINSISLSGDKYVNFALNMLMEIVASLLLMMMLERYGRKKSIFVAFLLCGVACVAPYFISHHGAERGLYFLGKLSITFAFNSLYVFTAELFPTSMRSSALAACSLIGRLGSIIAPQTPLLGFYVQAFLYGGCSLLAALAALLTPETRRMRLPQGVLDAELIRKESLIIKPPTPPLQVRVISHEP